LKWQSHGCPPGKALQDWLEAEAELKREIEQKDDTCWGV
jgi:hypothetical protein